MPDHTLALYEVVISSCTIIIVVVVVVIIVNLLPPTKEEWRRQMRSPAFVCLSVSKITQKRVHGFG